jgi:transcriptional regulator with XRE-family HTH domain
MSQSPNPSENPPGSVKAANVGHQAMEGIKSRSPRHVTLGERLRTARYFRNLTQQDLAGESFSKSYLSAVERGKMTPSIAALRLLAGRLEVPLAYLLGEQDLDLAKLNDPGADQVSTSEPARPPEEEQMAQRLDEAEDLLMRGDADAALERLGGQETATELGRRYQARWSWLHGWALLQKHRAQEAIVSLEQGLEAVHTAQDHRCEGHLYFTLANADAAQNQDTAAEHALKAALRCAEEIKDQELLGCIHEKYGAFLAARGRFQEAYEHMRCATVAASSSATARSPITQEGARKG